MFKLIKNCNYVIRMADSATIPNDSANLDWQEYQKWLLEDPQNKPLLADEEIILEQPILQ